MIAYFMGMPDNKKCNIKYLYICYSKGKAYSHSEYFYIQKDLSYYILQCSMFNVVA